MMTKPQWHLAQLLRMTRFFPERVEDAVSRLFESDPELRNDLVIGAVDQEMLSIEQAADFTGMIPSEIETRLIEFRNQMAFREVRIEADEDRPGSAKIAGAGIFVWEIMRVLQKGGSVDAVHVAFPTLNATEIRVAVDFGNAHLTEIEAEILRYEQVVKRRQSEYPYAK
jgi:uncharacterized protein (DUF433 family)